MVLTDPDNVRVRRSTRESDEPLTYGNLKRHSSQTEVPRLSFKSMWDETGGESDTGFVKKVVIGVVVVVILIMGLIS